MKAAVMVLLALCAGLLAHPAMALDAKATKLYEQISQLGLSTPVAEWLAEEAANARVRTIKVGKTGSNYGVSSSGGRIVVQDSGGGRSLRNLTHEIAHIGTNLSGHDCRWIRYLTAMAVRYEARFGAGKAWGTHSLESYYPRYRLDRCRS